MATLHRSDAIAAKVPKRLRGPLTRRGLIVNNSWRGPTVSADGVAHLCEQEGLACISQELVNWGHGLYLIDAISVFTPATSRFARPLRRYDNRGFMREAHGLAKIATLYGPSEP
jgi:hypothetical protein